MYQNEQAVKDIKKSGSNPIKKPEVVENVKILLASRDGKNRLNELLGAQAFALGTKIAIASGGSDLNTIAHEAAHVIQQRNG